MWMVPPKILCRKHLLGEHVELHMLVGSIRRGKNLTGFRNLVETKSITERHAELTEEMYRRCYTHRTPMVYDDKLNFGSVNRDESFRELQNRCEDCRNRILSFMIESVRSE